MKLSNLLMVCIIATLLCMANVAMGQEVVANAQPVVVQPSQPNPNSFKLGMLFDLADPSGVALGLETRLPYLPWFKLGVAATGTLMVGVRGNLLIDPINFPIAPVANLDIGHQFPMSIPTVHNSPSVSFTYYDLQGGLGLGKRDGFRFL